jgi:uncharacterized protein (TIGR02996 family)
MPTPAEEQAFLKPILARFHADGPRLIYADYLDESDDPSDHDRAEFIRLQLAVARLPSEHPQRGSLKERQSEILLRRHDEWTRHLRGLAAGFEFRRGLIDSVTVDVSTFLARGGELFRLAPICRVRFTEVSGQIGKLVHCPLLVKVREIVLCGAELGNGGVNVLLRSPYLGRVRSLDLSFNGLCDGGVNRLAESGALPKLQSLYLNDNGRITAESMKRLAESTHLGRLQELDVSANQIDGAGLAALASSTHLKRLRSLRFHSNPIGDEGCEVLARSPLLPSMLAHDPRLDLHQTHIGLAGARALATSSHLSGVRALDLSENQIQNEGLIALAESQHTAKLTILRLRHNQLSDPGAVVLARSSLMKQLTLIDVSSNRLTQRGIDELWKHRRDWHVVIQCEGNLPGVTGPSERARTRP